MNIERRLNLAAAKSRSLPFGKPSTSPPRCPDIIDFVSNPDYLGDLRLFPLQLLLLKIIFLVEHAWFTAFDWQWIDRLGRGFELGHERDATHYEGVEGFAPDVLERMDDCRARGRRWFREIIAVIGRRGGKGYLASICAAYVLWTYICDGDPHARSGVTKSTRLSMLVFAVTERQARDTQWQVMVDLIRNAPCFEPYIADDTRGRLLLYAHDQLVDGKPVVAKEAATFEILACGATEQAARGRAVIAAFFDEIAWMTGGGANRSAEEIYPAATPALRTFEDRAFIWAASSPWHQEGRFYELYRAALQVDPGTGKPAYPFMFTVQLPSWRVYEGWELTTNCTFEMTPGGLVLPPKKGPLLAYDDALRAEEALNPETFDVEYRSNWSAALNPYLDQHHVENIFQADLSFPSHGILALAPTYVGYADPGFVDDHFAFVIVHAEKDEDALPIVIVDAIEDWDPAHFGGAVPIEHAEEQLFGYLDRFRLRSLTFDQFNGEALAGNLRGRAADLNWNPSIGVHHINRREAYQRAETFKRLAYAGRILSPFHGLARDELRALRDNHGRIEAPTTGRTTKDDIAIALVNAVAIAVEPHWELIHQLGAMKLRASQPGGIPIPPPPPSLGPGGFERNPLADQLEGTIRVNRVDSLLRPRYRPSAARGGRFFR
jgi:hypothetical protein